LEQSILLFFSTFFGLLVGSFLNALIYRLPREINIAFPRSHCPTCKATVAWYDNLPVISYLILRGKCRNCKTKISVEYPLIEILVAVVAFFLAPSKMNSNAIFSGLFYFSIFCVFLVHFIVDLKHQILPDLLNLYLACLFFAVSFINHPYYYWGLGALIGIGFPAGISFLFYKLKGQVGLGGGDIKLWGALGLYLGPLGIIHNIFLSCFFGALVGGALLASKIIKRETPIPFGPFIIVVAFLQIFFAEWFQHMMRYIS
jgi:prepilin signal peptidase PulO-like enzyme (type II secretory pathway)